MVTETGESPEPHTPAEQEAALRKMYDGRYREYWRIGDLVAAKADKLGWWGNVLRVTAISLSAITAVKGTLESLAGADNSCLVVALMTVAIFTTVVLGIEAAFKFEKRAAALAAQGSQIASAHRRLETDWMSLIGIDDERKRIEQKEKVLKEDDKTISGIYGAVAEAGYNLQSSYITRYHPWLREADPRGVSAVTA